MRLRIPAQARYIAIRIAFIPIASFIVLTIAYFLVNLVPSDPAKVVLGNLAGPQQIAAFNHVHGIDQPLQVRYWRYVTRLFHGDLGVSFYDNSDVLDQIGKRIVSSLELVVLGLVVAWVLGTLLGALAAYYRGRWIDNAVGLVVGLVQSVPDFVIGLLGALFLAFSFTILPAPSGQLPIGYIPAHDTTGAAFVDAIIHGDGALIGPAFRQLVLPVLALGISNSVIFARTVRATLGQALDSNYSEFARARGLRSRTVVRLALRASLLPTVTYTGIVFANLLGGDAVVEKVFGWQGIGQWGVEGVQRSDIPTTEGFVIVTGVVAIVVYLLSDLLGTALDPRLRAGIGRRGSASALGIAPPLLLNQAALEQSLPIGESEPVVAATSGSAEGSAS